ncbi:TPA: hypothetical protein ACH3X3_012009 [Trebouxia sp. C0006]
MPETNHKPVQLALIGAGLFTKDAYVPLLRRHASTVQICAVWSRSAKATDILLPLIQEFAPNVKGFHGDDQLDKLLRDPNVDAVAVVLPVQVMLQVAQKCLKAGKHVLQEKPVAQSVEVVNRAIKDFHQLSQQPVWALAENYRSEQGFHKACQMMHELETIIKVKLSDSSASAASSMSIWPAFYPACTTSTSTETCSDAMSGSVLRLH